MDGLRQRQRLETIRRIEVGRQAGVRLPAVGEYSVSARGWSSSSNKKWRARDPTDENIEKTNPMHPMYVDEERKPSTPTVKDMPMDPTVDTSKLKIARDEEFQEEERKRKEESRAQYMLKRDKPTARPRAKSAGPPGWRPPAKEDTEYGCLGPLEPLPPPHQKGRSNQCQEPPPPPKRRPPAGMGEPQQQQETPAAVLKERAPPPPPPLSEMPAALREREGAKLTARGKDDFDTEGDCEGTAFSGGNTRGGGRLQPEENRGGVGKRASPATRGKTRRWTPWQGGRAR